MAMSFIYVTTESREEARSIADTVISERLAACANIYGDIESVYRWNGVIERQTEVSMILKTKNSLVRKAIARVEELHNYETPCAAAISITDAPAAYLKWIEDETGPPSAMDREV